MVAVFARVSHHKALAGAAPFSLSFKSVLTLLAAKSACNFQSHYVSAALEKCAKQMNAGKVEVIVVVVILFVVLVVKYGL